MKDSKKYSKKVQGLYRSLKRKHPKVKKASFEEITDALVYGIINEKMSEKATRAASRRFADYFVDLNDLRVSREEEIVEMLGEDTAVTRDTATTLTRTLGAIFSEYHKVSLDSLKKVGKRPAKQALEKIEGVSRFVVNYCMLTSLQGHAIPLTQKMIEYLRSIEVVHPEANEQEIEGFLTKQIPARNGHEFYALLRRESETRSARKTGEKTDKETGEGKAKKETKTTGKKKPKRATKTKKKTTKSEKVKVRRKKS